MTGANLATGRISVQASRLRGELELAVVLCHVYLQLVGVGT
jgi:hypothetical protein